MRTALLLILCLAQAFPCFAASCQDMRDAVGSAMQQRNGRVSDTHNTMIPDPESERDALSGCLGSINANPNGMPCPAVSAPSMPSATLSALA